jgi:Tol biopolymer transport system component
MNGRYLNSGHIAYTMNNQIYICRFNSKRNRIVSDAQILETNPVRTTRDERSRFDFSNNGILVYLEQQSLNLKNLVWLDESGRVTPITREAKNYVITAISSEGQNIAVSVKTGEGSEANYHIETMDIKTGISQRFADNADWPVWSADNTSIIYRTGNQVFQKLLLDPSKPPVLLFKVDSATYIETHDLSLEGRYLTFTIGTSHGSAIGYYDMTNRKPKMLDYYNSSSWVYYPVISPDGKWVAYLQNVEGYIAVYVAPFPGPGRPILVSSPRIGNETNYPVWSPDMTALYYRTHIPDYEIWKVKILISDDQIYFEPAQSIFNGGHRFSTEQTTSNVEIHPDGDRFLLMQLESDTKEAVIEPRIKVIVNWEQELKNN